MNSKLFLSILVLVFSFQISNACTNLLVTKGASVDSSTMITYAADSHVLYGELYFKPAADYSDTATLAVYDWDGGSYLGRIKQVSHTYSVIGNMNEHQLVIAETTFGGKPNLRDTLGKIDYGSLIYITLQRAKTAREAIKIISELMDEYGYYSSGESFSIADTEEVWIMEIIGKGVGNKGAVWVAQRIPDGYISAHANQSRITTFPLNDPENCVYSKDVISFAREMKYFEGEDKDFSFSDAYAPVDFGGARFCDARVYAIFNRVVSGMNKYEDYAMGYNLHNRMPLWVKPNSKLNVHDAMELMRDYYQGTPMDMTQDVGAGPYACIVRYRPLTWEVDGKNYFNERAVSTQQTAFSFVSQSRGYLPNSIGGVLWFGVDDTYSTVYIPISCAATRVPYAFKVGVGGMMKFDSDAAFWIFNQVSNLAYTKYSYMGPEIRKVQGSLESYFIKNRLEAEEIALKLNEKSEKEAIEFLTKHGEVLTEATMKKWKELYAYLFVKYLDGNIKYKDPNNYNPKLEQPGYSEAYYKTLVKETKDKFLMKGAPSH